MHDGKIFTNGTRIHYQPLHIRDDIEAKRAMHRGHQGEVIGFTTDGFYRINWDNPNPDSLFFNLGTVFRPEDLQVVTCAN